MRYPDFENNIKKVLLKQKPARPTLFEFLISEEAESVLSGYELKNDSIEERIKRKITAFYNAGYDYVPFILGDLAFPANEHDLGIFEIADKYLPEGMKIMSYLPGGVLENVIALCGYENLCYLFADDYELAERIFYEVGSRLEKFITETIAFDSVGMIFCNDDWGFKNSTMISHDDLRNLVYPYYKRIAAKTHAAGKVIGMHSFGNFSGIFNELYEKIGFDGKHSFEDSIMPVETAYENYGDKIAILGGIDMDFMCRSDEESIRKRCFAMLEKSEDKGGYALGSGNSIAKYMPLKNYIALLKTVNKDLKI